MIFNDWKYAASVLLIIGGLLTGCEDKNESHSTTESSRAETAQTETAQTETKTLAEQGYELKTVLSYGENINIVSLEKNGSEYVAAIDDNFNWLMEPTDEYKFEDLEFIDGLSLASIPETREMILAQDPDAKLYGYINIKGEWVIKPVYRYANKFSNGVAVVNTVEEDRDDLSNSRTIVIDTAGREVGQLDQEGLDKLDLNDGESFFGSYLGDYLYTTFGFFDKQGNYREVYEEDPEESRSTRGSDFIVLNEKIIKTDGDNAISIESLDGSPIQTFEKTGNFTVENGEELIKNNLFLLAGDIVGGEGYAIADSDLNILFPPDGFTIGLAENLIFAGELSSDAESEIPSYSGDFYDFTGKKVFSVTDMVGAVYGDKYFVKGEEYFKLVDIHGNVLLDESQKITDTEAVLFDEGGRDNTPSKNLVRIEYRENAEDGEPNEALLNVDTLAIVDLEDLLKIENIETKEVKQTTEKQQADREIQEVTKNTDDLIEHKKEYWRFVEVLSNQVDLALNEAPQGTDGIYEILTNLKQLQEQLEGLAAPDDTAYQNYHQKLVSGLPPIIESIEKIIDIMQDNQAGFTPEQEAAINDELSNLEYQVFIFNSNSNALDGVKNALIEELKK